MYKCVSPLAAPSGSPDRGSSRQASPPHSSPPLRRFSGELKARYRVIHPASVIVIECDSSADVISSSCNIAARFVADAFKCDAMIVIFSLVLSISLSPIIFLALLRRMSRGGFYFKLPTLRFLPAKGDDISRYLSLSLSLPVREI